MVYTKQMQKSKFNNSVLRSIYNIIYYFFENYYYASLNTNEVEVEVGKNWEKSKQKGNLTLFLNISKTFHEKKKEYIKIKIFLDKIKNFNFNNQSLTTYKTLWNDAEAELNNNSLRNEESSGSGLGSTPQSTKIQSTTVDGSQSIEMKVYSTLTGFYFFDMNDELIVDLNMFKPLPLIKNLNKTYYIIVTAKELDNGFVSFKNDKVYLIKKQYLTAEIYKNITINTNQYKGKLLFFEKNKFDWKRYESLIFFTNSSNLEKVYEISSIKDNNNQIVYEELQIVNERLQNETSKQQQWIAKNKLFLNNKQELLSNMKPSNSQNMVSNIDTNKLLKTIH